MEECLRALDAPINLFSVGAMTEKNLELVFKRDITTITVPTTSHSSLAGQSLNTTVVHRLSFLACNFISPGLDVSPLPPSIAFPAVTPPSIASSTESFPQVKATPNLWHRRFGHLGRDATHAVLTKTYATGVAYEEPFLDDHCIPCIIGKLPQHRIHCHCASFDFSYIHTYTSFTHPQLSCPSDHTLRDVCIFIMSVAGLPTHSVSLALCYLGTEYSRLVPLTTC